MKKLMLTGLLILMGTVVSNAQEVEIKDDKVLLDGKAILKYEKINVWQHSFYSLVDDEELLMYKYSDNETNKYTEDDFCILNFLTVKKKVQTTDVSKAISGLGMNSRKNMEKLIKWLLKEKVFDAEGKLNPEKVETFFEKYDENITARTVR